MPANLTPEYQKAEQAYKNARTPEERLFHLEDMLRKIPKHKGTDHMQADLKRRLAKLKTSQEQRQGKRGYSPYVERVGLPQIALAGAPNSGKSSLLAALSNAKPDIADHAFTTRQPAPGIIRMEEARFQLVDLPPLSDQYMEHWVPQLIRVADMVLVTFNLGSDDVLENAEMVLEILEGARLKLVVSHPDPDTSTGTKELPAAFLGTQADRPGAGVGEELLREILDPTFPYLRVSAESGEGLDRISQQVFTSLDLMRIFTKAPGKEPVMDRPVLLPVGSTVMDVAEDVHREIAQDLKFARIWGSGRFDGQKVPSDYALADGDIVEINT